MTLKELKFFYLLCEDPHITNAARKLNLSQSAVSLAIQSLETKLGEKLFNRVGKKLVLNERGRYFKEQTYKHFLALYDAQTLFSKEKIAGTLKVAASKTISNYVMPGLYFDFLKKHSRVTFNAATHNSFEIAQQVKTANIDIGFIEYDIDDDTLEKISFAKDELILVTSDENAPTKCYIDAIDKKWILREDGSGTKELFMKNIGLYANEIKIFLQLNEFEEIKSLLLNNKDTVSAVSKRGVINELEEKKLFEIKPVNINFQREFYIIYLKNKPLNSLFSAFKEFVIDYI